MRHIKQDAYGSVLSDTCYQEHLKAALREELMALTRRKHLKEPKNGRRVCGFWSVTRSHGGNLVVTIEAGFEFEESSGRRGFFRFEENVGQRRRVPLLSRLRGPTSSLSDDVGYEMRIPPMAVDDLAGFAASTLAPCGTVWMV